jgi:hypothetical protein
MDHKIDPDYAKKVCRTCDRRIRFVRGSRGRKAFWQHDGGTDGFRWYADHRAMFGSN